MLKTLKKIFGIWVHWSLKAYTDYTRILMGIICKTTAHEFTEQSFSSQ